MFSQNIGGPGIGLHPQNLDVPCIWRSTGPTPPPVAAGQVVVLDIPATIGSVTGGASPGGDDSPFANVKICPTNVNVPRYGIFGVALTDAENGEQVMVRFAGVLGARKDGVAADVNPGDGVFVENRNDQSIGAGASLVIRQGTHNLQTENGTNAGTATGDDFFKIIGRNLNQQTGTTSTPQKSAVLFNGIYGFGVAVDGA